jgi:hypothetical protein
MFAFTTIVYEAEYKRNKIHFFSPIYYSIRKYVNHNQQSYMCLYAFMLNFVLKIIIFGI